MNIKYISAIVVIIIGGAASSAHAASLPAGFIANPAYYPSSLNPNFLPNGTLVRTATNSTVYYIKDGTRSMILPHIIDLWLQEAHYFKPDLITVISTADMNRYVVTKSVNPYYIGKILQAPDGSQYFIDDKLRKRPISSAVKKALLFPSRNLYPTSFAHLAEFATGLAITRTDVHPGGTVMYRGPYHGGTIWRIEQDSKGNLVKRLYLQDYLYETQGYPWSGQIVPVSETELAKYIRGANIDTYSDGWMVSLNGAVSVVEKGTLRHVTSSQLLTALAYPSKYILTVYPQFLKQYPAGIPIAAFKNMTSPAASLPVPKTIPTSTVSKYPELHPAAAALIGQINDLFLPIYDREPSPTENAFWVDYIYKGEVGTKDALVAAMQKAHTSGVLPLITSRTATLSTSVLKSKWFPYLFYFVWHHDASDAAKAYWYSRIDNGDWTTIQGLGGTIRYLQETFGKEYK
ncbi:MAG TPA: hypothetical protein VLG69_00115 [Candidatus Andersenbacteria bacterium]|nr:hypothetical protein [Candidatus Andersenbacteria bacterium]